MRHIKRRAKIFASILMAAVVVFTMIAFFPAASAEPADSDIEIFSSEAVVLDTDHYGDIEKVRIVTFFGLTGDGSVDVYKEKTLEGESKWQGVHGFTTPVVEGDYLVWRGLDVDGFRNVMSSTEIKNEGMVEEVSLRIPLDLQYRYYLDGEEVDPETITGKSGHFRLELTMTNTSAEMTTLEYEDPATGEMKTKEVETYIPLAILPYDWYFDNNVFFNLEADPTGIVVPLPDHYQIGWSIPLFPPATEASNTIWIEADVKDFRLPTLVLSANFVFPQTNQRDPIPEFIVGLETLYDGVRQMKDGLGTTETEDTLLYGAAAIKDGLEQMAEGLPEAQAALNTQLIPGVDEAVAGIGTPGTPDTLIYAINATSVGLMSMVGGIGGPDVANSALYALSAMSAGLEEMTAGIGSTDTPDSLLYAADQVAANLEKMEQGIGSAAMEDTLFFAMSGMRDGLLEMKEGIGSPDTDLSLLNGVFQVKGGLQQLKDGISSPVGDPDLLYAIEQVEAGLNEILAGIGSPETPDTALYALTEMIDGMYLLIGACMGSIGFVNLAKNEINDVGGLRDLVSEYMPEPQRTKALNYIDHPLLGINSYLDLANQLTIQIWNGIGDPGAKDSLLYGCNELRKGMEEMKVGIGSPNSDPSLLFAMAKMKEGMVDEFLPGIDLMLYGCGEIANGLDRMLVGIGSATTNPSLLYGVDQVEYGLKLMKDGIGSANADDTLLYAMSAMSGGLNEMKEGIGTSATTDSLLYAAAQVSNGMELMKAGIGAEGVPDTLLYAMAQVQHGLHKMKTGLSSGDLNDPGLKEGLIMVSAGLGDAVSGLGSVSTPDTLVYGADQIEAGLTEMGDGTGQMYEGLAGNLAELYLTESQLEAIKIRGEEFNHIMGSTENAENSLAFIYQAPPTYNYKQGSKSSWMVAGMISMVIVIALLLMSLLLRRRPVIG